MDFLLIPIFACVKKVSEENLLFDVKKLSEENLHTYILQGRQTYKKTSVFFAVEKHICWHSQKLQLSDDNLLSNIVSAMSEVVPTSLLASLVSVSVCSVSVVSRSRQTMYSSQTLQGDNTSPAETLECLNLQFQTDAIFADNLDIEGKLSANMASVWACWVQHSGDFAGLVNTLGPKLWNLFSPSFTIGCLF